MHYYNTQQSVKYLLLTCYGFQKSRCCHLQKKNTFELKYKFTNTFFFCIAFVNSYFDEKHFQLKIESSIAETNSKSTKSGSNMMNELGT